MADIQEKNSPVIFDTECDVLVNTVNCKGVMGAGIALACKHQFPGLFEFYAPFCQSGDLKPGKLLLFRDSQPQILCFPTKIEWKRPAKLSYIQSGLTKFAATYRDKGITSIAFPQLGCSHGGLNWEDEVSPLMYEILEPLENLTVEIYSFDPMATDSRYDKLVGWLLGMSPKDIGTELGLRTQDANSLRFAMDSGDIHNMFTLEGSKGIGTVTTSKVYEYLRKSTSEEPSCERIDGRLAYDSMR